MRFFHAATLLILGLLAARPSQAQQPADTMIAPARPVYKPVYLLNSRTIIGDNGLRAINPSDIEKIEVYKSRNMPARWRGLAEHGVLAITLKHRLRLKTKTAASLRHWLQLTEPVRFELDGLPLEDTSLRIATEAIAGLEVTRATAGAPAGTVVNIRLVRTGPTPPPPGPVVPGRIFIRGTAGL